MLPFRAVLKIGYRRMMWRFFFCSDLLLVSCTKSGYLLGSSWKEEVRDVGKGEQEGRLTEQDRVEQ
jgi:hypothetical protein